MRIYLWSMSVVRLLLYSGSGTAQQVDFSPRVAAISPFVLVDERPAADRKTKPLSVWMWSCDYAVLNVGDKGLDKPGVGKSRVSELEARLAKVLTQSSTGHSILLKKYRMVINGGSEAMGSSLETGFGGGAIAPLIADGKTRKSKCSREKMTAGWFAPEELSNSNSPLVIEIELSVDGNPIYVRKVHSPTREMMSSGGYRKFNPDDIAEFQSVIDQANDEAASQVAQHLGIVVAGQS